MKKKDIYDEIKPEKESVIKVKKAKSNDKTVIIGMTVIMILIVAGIIAYYFLIKGTGKIASFTMALNVSTIDADGKEVLTEGTEKTEVKITEAEYELYYRTFAPMLVYYGYSTDAIRSYVAEKIVLDRIVLEEARLKGYTVSEETKNEIEETFKSDEYVKDFTSRGIDLEKIKQLFYDDSIISEYIEDLKKSASEEDVKAYLIASEGDDTDLNLYSTRHIFFQITTSMTDEEKATLKAEANAMLTKVLQGGDFATLAKENSDDTYTETYLDGIVKATKTNVVEEYYNAAKSLKAGAIYNGVVESSYGYHVIKLDSVTENGRLTDTDEIASYVDNMLYKKQEATLPVYNDEKIEKIATSINNELGLVVATK